MIQPNNYTIFIIDDEIRILNMLKTVFELNGYTCHITTDTPKAEQMIEQVKPDLIISDVSMPLMNGFELRRRILRNNAIKGIPFIFLTSNDDDINMLLGYGLEINDYISKTTSNRILLKKIKSTLDAARRVKETIIKQATRNFTSAKQESIQHGGLQINYLNLPHENIPGGDIVEIIEIDEDRKVIVLGDVMGKRWDAWFHSLPFKAYIKNSLATLGKNAILDPGHVLNDLNETLLKDEPLSTYSIALALIVVDGRTGTLSLSGAGCYPFVKLDADGNKKEIAPIECALGISPKVHYKSETITLHPGEKLFGFTDGVIEIQNRHKQQLGFYGLLSALTQYPPAGEISWFEKFAREFSENKLGDDFSVLEIKAAGAAV